MVLGVGRPNPVQVGIPKSGTIDTPARMALGFPSGLVQSRAWGSRCPVGSRRSSQRRATVGWPEWYQRAVPVAARRCLREPSGQRWVRGNTVYLECRSQD